MSIDEILQEKVKQEVKREVSEQLAPIKSLPEKFANKITLSIDDMCEILGVENSKSGKESIRNAAKNGDLPYRRFGRDFIFPRPMVEAYLFGEWKESIKIELKPNVSEMADKLR
jgi:hypothetical protein